ncbi:MAG: hypothetical protein LBM00_11755 [Deltaproteobacteria bacterium]|jgi:hypothetical protein|nr:hypothetical protein [Deltaproteobacteria bacterium]
MTQLTSEKKLEILTQSQIASSRGDYEEAKRILNQMPMAPWLAKGIKEIFGAEPFKDGIYQQPRRNMDKTGLIAKFAVNMEQSWEAHQLVAIYPAMKKRNDFLEESLGILK